ncbi:hypothetical protein AB4076_20305 [Dyella sp. 2RAF44]|jgi:hypothetical protein
MSFMYLLRDLQYIRDGGTPATILALVRMGYATFPPTRLTEAGVALLLKLSDEAQVRTPDEPI